MIRGCEFILPGCGGTSTLSRGATLAACWVHETPSISNQPMEACFHTVRGGIEPRDHFCRPWTNRVVDTCKKILVRGWYSILLG